MRKELGEWLDKNISPELIESTWILLTTANIPYANDFAKNSVKKGGFAPNGRRNTGEQDFPPDTPPSWREKSVKECYGHLVFWAV